MIADIPAGLPTPAIPDVGLGEIGALSGGALALALVALAESIGAARSLAAKGGYEIDPNQELIALGASNVGGRPAAGVPGRRQPLPQCGRRRRPAFARGCRG